MIQNNNITKSDFFENYLKSIPNYNNEGRKKTCYILWKGNTNFYLNLLKFLKFLEGNIRTPLDTTVKKIMEWILEAKPNADTNSRFPFDIISYLTTYGFIIRKNKFLYLTNLSKELLKTPTEKYVLIILMKTIVGFEFFLKYGNEEYSKTELMEIWTKDYTEAYKNNDLYKITNDDYLHKQFDRRIKWLIALKYIQKKGKKYFIMNDNWPNFRPMNREINMKKNRSNNDQTEPYLKKHTTLKKPFYISQKSLAKRTLDNAIENKQKIDDHENLEKYHLTKQMLKEKYQIFRGKEGFGADYGFKVNKFGVKFPIGLSTFRKLQKYYSRWKLDDEQIIEDADFKRTNSSVYSIENKNDISSLRQMIFSFLNKNPSITLYSLYNYFKGENEGTLRTYYNEYFRILKKLDKLTTLEKSERIETPVVGNEEMPLPLVELETYLKNHTKFQHIYRPFIFKTLLENEGIITHKELIEKFFRQCAEKKIKASENGLLTVLNSVNFRKDFIILVEPGDKIKLNLKLDNNELIIDLISFCERKILEGIAYRRKIDKPVEKKRKIDDSESLEKYHLTKPTLKKPYLKKNTTLKHTHYIRSLLHAYEIYNSFKNIQPGKIDLDSLSDLYKYILANYKKEQLFPDFEIASNYEGISLHGFKKPINIAYGMLEFLKKIYLLKKMGRNYSLNEENKFTYYFLGNLDESSRFLEIFKEYLQEKIISIKFFRVLIQFLKTCNYGINSNIVDNLGTEMIYWTTEILKYNSLLKTPIKRLINTKFKNQGVKKPFNPVVVQIGLNILLELKIIQLVNKNYSIKTDFLNLKRIQEIEKYDINRQHKIINSKKIPHHFEIILFEIINTNNSNNIFYYSKKNEFQFYLQNFEKLIHFNKIKFVNIESIEMQNLKRITIDFLKTQDFNNVIFTESQMILFKIVGPSFISGDFITDFKIDKEINYFIKEFFSIFPNFNLKEDNHYHNKNESLNQLEIKKKILTMYLSPDTNGVFHCICSKSFLNENPFLKHIHNCVPFYKSLIGEKRLKIINFKELWEENKNGHYNCICGKVYTNRGFLLKHLIGCEQEISSIRPDDHKEKFELEEFSIGNKEKDYAAIENLLKKTNEGNFHCLCGRTYLSARKTDILMHIKNCKIFNERLELYINNYKDLNNIDLNKITLLYLEEQGFQINGRQLLYEIFDYCGSKFSELINKDFISIIPAKIEIIKPRNKVDAVEVEQNNINYKMIFNVPAKIPNLVYEFLRIAIENSCILRSEIISICRNNTQDNRKYEYLDYLIGNNYLKVNSYEFLFITKIGRALFKAIKKNESKILEIITLTFLPYVGYLNYLTTNNYDPFNYFKGENSILKQYLVHYFEKQEDVRIVFHFWDYKLGITKYQNRNIYRDKVNEILEDLKTQTKIISDTIFYFDENDYRNTDNSEELKRNQKICLIINLIIANEKKNSCLNIENLLKFNDLFREVSYQNFLELIKCINLNGILTGIDKEQKVLYLKDNVKFVITKNETINNLKEIYYLDEIAIEDFKDAIFNYLNNNYIISYNYDKAQSIESSIQFEILNNKFSQITFDVYDNDNLDFWDKLSPLLNKPREENNVLVNIFSVLSLDENDEINNFFNNPNLLIEENLRNIEKLYFHEEIPYYGIIPLFKDNPNYYNYSEIGNFFINLMNKEDNNYKQILCALFFYFVPHFRIFIVILDIIKYPTLSEKIELDYYNQEILMFNQERLNLFRVIEYFLKDFGYDIINESYNQDIEKISNIIKNIWNFSQNLNLIDRKGNVIESSEYFNSFFYSEYKYNLRKHVKDVLKKEFVIFLNNNIDVLKEN